MTPVIVTPHNKMRPLDPVRLLAGMIALRVLLVASKLADTDEAKVLLEAARLAEQIQEMRS
jgi:hypothetical protein